VTVDCKWKASVAFAVEDLIQRLGILTCPRRYSDFVAEVGGAKLEGTLASPAEICALNLSSRAREAPAPNGRYFLLFRQDGDYWILPRDDARDAVLRWSHETHRVSATTITSKGALMGLAASLSPVPVADGECLMISRVVPYTQSMLDPIVLSQLHTAAAALDGATVFEFAEVTNPFTGEPRRIRRPGVRIRLAQRKRMFFVLSDGHLYCNDAPRVTPRGVGGLAAKLAARVSRYGPAYI
jgi:hypothetical protein